MRIGIYRSCGIGDAVQLTPLLQQIRADIPSAEVTFFTSENVAEILDGCPLIDQTVIFPTRLITGAAAEWGGFPIWRRISLHGTWDLFLDLEPLWRRSLGILLVRAARKGGVQGEGWKPLRLFDEFLTQHPHCLDRGHASARYLNLWQKLTGWQDRGFGYNLSHLRIPPSSLPELPAKPVCLVPGAGNPMKSGEAKRWPLEYWLLLADRLASEGFSPVWLGSPDDARQFPVNGTHLNLMGQLSLRQTFQVIDRSVALIGNDSGLFHVALATKAKAVALFGPTNPEHTGPFRNELVQVFKAGYGLLPTCSLQGAKGRELNAIQRVEPMESLKPEMILPEILGFLHAPVE
jgi:ADP-heptose:LPS heptosyltransferase